jgi:glycosyltransferase involved in cell wall biosynthesis
VLDSGTRRGAEIFASDLITALNDAGVRQRIVVVHPDGRREVRFEAPVHRLASTGWATPGFHVDLGTVRELRRHVRRWDPDVIQSHGGDSSKYAIVSTRSLEAPVVLRAIGTAPTKIGRGPGRLLYRWLYRSAAGVVAVAQTVRSEILSLFNVPGHRVWAIPNAVDESRMRPQRARAHMRSELGIGPDTPVVLSMGALTWEKDPMAHLEIGRRVQLRVPGAVHLLAGDGPARSDVEASVRRLRRDADVRLLGMRRDVADILNASDVLLFASRSDGMEGLPAVVIEAGMVGVPVVGYRVAGVHEVVLDGATGLLAAPGDVNGVVERAIELLTDEPKRRRLGRAGRKRCSTRFEIGPVADRYIEVYDQVRRRRGSSRTEPRRWNEAMSPEIP